MKWKKTMSLILAVSMTVPGIIGGLGKMPVQAAEEKVNEAERESYNLALDFAGGIQGPAWYHEYQFTSGNDKGKRMQYEEWIEDWNCFIALEGVLTSGMENGMGLIAPAPTADSLAVWEAPRDGVVEVSMAHQAYLRRQYQTSGNVGVYIEKNGKKIYPASGEILLQAQSKMYLYPIPVQVRTGDRIAVGLTSKKNLTDASVYITPVISYVEKEAVEKENAAVGANVTASSTADGYSVNGLTDYILSEQHQQYEWKAKTAEQEWLDFGFESSKVSDIVLVDGSGGAYTGNIRCTFSDGTAVEFASEQAAAKEGIRTFSLEAPVSASSVKIEFINTDGVIPVLGDIQILTVRREQGEEPGGEAAEPGIYYVDSAAGSDSNDGKSEDGAWATLDKVNSMQFAPGTKILFKAGTTYKGALVLQGSGTEEAPIIVDMYGEGPKPHTEGEGKVRHTVHLKNVNHVTVRNLEVSNNAAQRQLLSGVFVEASGCGVMEDVHLDSLDVHDVYGTLDEKTLPNGGIYYEVTDESDDTRFNNISVQNCTVKRVSRTGISVGMTESYELWDGHGGIIPDEVKEKYGHTNVVIRNNYVEEAGGDAIVPMFSISPLIEYNISNKASVNTKDQWTMYNAAIWPWRCEDAVFQFNEAYDTYENGDGQAYDCDWSRHTTYQYNYSHNNKGGFILVCQNEALDSVIRYNVSQNDEDSLFLMSNPDNADVYNNTFYIGPNLKKVVDLNGKATLKNNIFYCPEGIELPNNNWGSGFTYDTNLFYGFDTTPNDPNKILADPMFADPGKGGTGTEPGKPALDSLGGYALQEDSPAINAGIRIPDNGGRDFAGNPVGETKPDLGAFESDVEELMTLKEEEILVTDAGAVTKVETIVKEGAELEGGITYTSSDENVAAADETGHITFYGYGTAVINVSARINGKEVSLKCRVILKESDYESFSGQFENAYANTQDVQNPVSCLIDGDSSSFWHTQWNGSGFELTQENPAILTLKLRDDANVHNGFRFLQRPSNENGLVQKFKYVVGNTFDEALNQITDGVESPEIMVANPANGSWVNVDLPEGMDGKYIQIQILQGEGEFGAVAEVETYNQIRYATAENNLILAQNKLERTEKELKEALQRVEELKEEASGNAEQIEALQKAVKQAEEAAQKAEKARDELQKALDKVQAEKDEAEAELEKAKAEAEKAKVEAEKAKAEADKAKAEAEKAEAEAKRAEAEAKKARDELEKAKTEADIARTEVEKAQAEAEKTKAEAEKARAEADKAKAEADRANTEEKKAWAEAERLKKELEEVKKELELQKELKKGDSVTYKNVVYKVTDPSKKTVAAVKGNDVSAITIAKSVKIKGITCTVTKIADKAFMNAKKLSRVTIGENVTTIGKQAFYGARKLKSINIRTRKLTTVGKSAFAKIGKKAKISVPKSKKAKYSKQLKGKTSLDARIK